MFCARLTLLLRLVCVVVRLCVLFFFLRTIECTFSSYAIFPGHGSTFVSRDGSVHNFINAKNKSLFMQKKKASKIGWTPAWRILHKKGKSIVSKRRRVKKGVNSTAKRAIGSLSVDEIRKRRNQTKDFRAAQRAEALRCVLLESTWLACGVPAASPCLSQLFCALCGEPLLNCFLLVLLFGSELKARKGKGKKK